MHVAIAIVTFRNTEEVLRCLEALSVAAHTDFEVVLWENGGAEAHARLVAEAPSTLPGGQPVRIRLSPSNLGYAGGVNGCLRETPDADAWWVLNPDTTPEPQALAELVKRLEAGDCDAVGGVLYLPGGTIQAAGGRWNSWLARAVSIGHGAPLVDRPSISLKAARLQNYLHGASMLVGRAFRDAAGPMREDYFLYCEEVEWCLRAAKRGMRLGVAAEAVVRHVGGSATGNSSDMRRQTRLPVYLNERNRLLVTRDLFPGRLPVTACLALVVLTLRFGKRGAWRQLAFALDGWRAGLANERGPPAWNSTA
jgi:GT2 family glycosyltransferase